MLNWTEEHILVKSFIRPGLLLLGTLMAGSLLGNTGGEKTLRLYHTHTGKSLQVVFYSHGQYNEQAFADLRVFLADWRNGYQHDLDPGLMEILWQLQQVTGSSETWEVISAYRSPETNEILRNRGSAVAKRSQHLLGKAIDVRLRGTDLGELRDAAKKLKMGGVGYYSKSNFVHVDTGRVRYW